MRSQANSLSLFTNISSDGQSSDCRVPVPVTGRNTVKKVLLIEDDPRDAYLLERALLFEIPEDFVLQTAASLADAAAKLKEETFHVILLDLNLPDSQGLKTFEAVYEQVPGIPIIILTGQQGEKIAGEAVRLGAEDYLVKGEFNHTSLLRTLRYSVERRGIRERLETVSEELRSVNQRLEELTLLDPLTQLLNRRGLQNILFRELDLARRGESALLALMANLDNFKQVNARLGHGAGDIVLREIARRLKQALRVSDYIARLGGDEFVILLPQTRLAEGIRVAEKIRLSISQTPVSVNSGKAIHITASLGLISVSDETASIDRLLAQTQPLLCQSKNNGKNRVSYEKGDPGRQDADELSEIKSALQDASLFLTLRQPIIDLRKETRVGYEFLSRSSVAGFEMPDDFFRFCMEADILTFVDHHCFQACVRAGQSLPQEAWRHINLFPSTMMAMPVDRLIEVISFCEPGRYCIEISEQQIIGDPSYLTEPVRALKQQGISIGIDDVGFGRSCLESLVLLEPDIVKIDKKWVIGIKEDATRRHSLRRLLKVTSSLGCEVVAEGVESSDELDVLREMGVLYGQGFLFGKPS